MRSRVFSDFGHEVRTLALPTGTVVKPRTPVPIGEAAGRAAIVKTTGWRAHTPRPALSRHGAVRAARVEAVDRRMQVAMVDCVLYTRRAASLS